MIINPKIIAEMWVIWNIQNPEEQIQQNWIDLTVKSIQKLWTRANILKINERFHTTREDLEWADDNTILLTPWVYDIELNETINIPENMAAPQIYTRSTVVRGGNNIISWFWDSGYQGPLGVMFIVRIPLILEKNVRNFHFPLLWV